ncbi:MAG: alpha/beta hydrolase [Pseudomonadota bacterium]
MAAFFRQFATQEALEAAYDVEASVPDFAAYARQFVESAARTREKQPCELGVRFGPTVEEYADIFPATRRGAPIFIFIHGGFWRSLSARDFSFCAAGLQRAGVTAVVANYTIAPAARIGEMVRQMRALVAWCYANADAINGDAEAIYVCGHSAGGHLTATTLLSDWAKDYGLPADTVKGGIAISGLFDLAPIKLVPFVQNDLRLTDEEVELFSPSRHLRRVRANLIVTYGSEEPSEFLRQSDEFLAGWRQTGNRGSFLPQPGRNHFTAITDLAEPGSDLCRAILGMMGHTHRSSPPLRHSAVPSIGDLMKGVEV